MARAIDKEDGCYECIHSGPWRNGRSFCNYYQNIIYISGETGVYKRVLAHGEIEKHKTIGTCEKWEPRFDEN